MSAADATAAQEPKQPPWRIDSLAGSVIILLGLTVAQRLIGFVRGVLFCRWLDVEQLGQWDLTFGFLMMAAPVALLGLPGSFGRYVEYFRQRDQLKMFLRRMGASSALLALIAMSIAVFGQRWFSQLIFGGDEFGRLIVLSALTLGAWIAHNVLLRTVQRPADDARRLCYAVFQ